MMMMIWFRLCKWHNYLDYLCISLQYRQLTLCVAVLLSYSSLI